MEPLLLGTVWGQLWQGDTAGTPSWPSTAWRGQAQSVVGLQVGNQSLVGRRLVGEQGFSSHLLGTEVSVSPHTHLSILPHHLAWCPSQLHPTCQGRSLHRQLAQHSEPVWLFCGTWRGASRPTGTPPSTPLPRGQCSYPAEPSLSRNEEPGKS